MKLVSLFSGGKDSTYATYLAQKAGHEVQYLLSLISESSESYMFHVPNIELTSLLSEALDIPLIQKRTKGEKEKELEDLKSALSPLEVDGIVSGAIASKYQYERISKVASELGLRLYSPLWNRSQPIVLKEEVSAGFEIIFVSVSVQGLDEMWLGRKIDEKCVEDLINLHKKYKINISGEGGEFETLVLNGPNFYKKLVIQDFEVIWEKNSGILKIKNAKLEPK